MELYSSTIHELHELLKKGEVTSQDITESVLKRIGEVEDRVGAYITLNPHIAMDTAREADEEIRKGNINYLTGIPAGIKDLMCTQGIRTTCGSKILENFIPPYDATVIRKLKELHFVMTGKLNMDEFAMGSSTEHSALKTTRNPWNLDMIPGGSSGGSTAAVAADECIYSLGSDTGGSIRQPASLCGVVGLKPTYGRVSRYGLVAFASSLDQIGPITKDVTDCAMVLNAISGYDRYDSTSVPRDVPDYTQALRDDLGGFTLGVPKEYFVEGMDPDVQASAKKAISLLEELGAHVTEVSLPCTEFGVAAYYIIAPAEASSNLARYDGVKYGYRARDERELLDMYRKTRSEGFGPEVKRRIMLGTYALSAGYYDAYYKKALQVRTLMIRDFEQAFEKCDVLVAPVSPTPAFKIGEKTGDPLQMYLCDVLTIPASLSGIPGISIPCGFSRTGLPIGLQILGRHFEEEKILRVAYNFEQNTTYHLKKPPL
jgi:aspartyl-tRNA(Asn)/glutamyl-tRNA(Gln) amidotransferase subunit A